jgi:hypothetical protein
VAVFDNDTAAAVALRGLAKTDFPANIRVLQLPPLELAGDYPTIGPQGRVRLDVNGLAGSIELYFGKDVLTADDGDLVPVQWKGLDTTIGRYQAEVLQKDLLIERYRSLQEAVRGDKHRLTSHDWSGMDAVCQSIFNAFQE